MTPVKVAKKELRQRMKVAIASMTGDKIQRESANVFNQLRNLTQYQTSTRIGVYLNMKDEVQTDDIVKDILASGKQCFIPRYDSNSNHMDMVRVPSWQHVLTLPETRWHVRQPRLDAEYPLASLEVPLHLLLVPGVAFSYVCGGDGGVANRCVQRLGRGRGYYDTYLRRCGAGGVSDGSGESEATGGGSNPPFTIGLALSVQVCDSVPIEDGDIPLDMLLSSS